MASILGGLARHIASKLLVINGAAAQSKQLHTAAICQGRNFLDYNKKIYPPQEPDEKPRPAFVCHRIDNIKYSPDKMWYLACLVRGMTIDEAIRQIQFLPKKGATYILQALREAQEMAVKEHNVEFRSNLWVAESFVGKGVVIKGIRRHARMRVGRVEYKYCHYLVRLEEGPPPADYYGKKTTPEAQLDQWLEKKRKRGIPMSL